jgi:ATP-dependent protease ClpP protease subunit
VKRIAVEGAFTEELAERVVREIRAAAGSPVDLRIDSEGGMFAALIQIALEVEEHNKPVFTTVTNYAGSAAGLLALAGDVRRIAPTGTLMLHYGRPGGRESAAEMRGIVREYTEASHDDIVAWLAREKVFGAEEAICFGLVDRIVDATAPEPVRLRDPVKRQPTKWLRPWRALFEELDLRSFEMVATP